ncbi:integrase catalytic domain-containing protein [Trichonephila clavata]|uniref:Integrase catalytic domain-containing protein n=1 Tax=Trichonephila clavata TaxID=2740835 RepID=A0A8X6FCH0_TRICU|nr:integrase catalytic domain-containing protein [Trichonephila clavata]
MRKTIAITLVKTDDSDWYYKYFSSIRKIVRMLAWIFRFYFKLRKTTFDCSENSSVSELERAEIALMLLIQKESFNGINDDRVINLRPIVDSKGLIRAKLMLLIEMILRTLARVEKLIPGRDGQIRLAVVKTANSEFLRPVQRLFRLEMDSPVLSVADDSASVVTRS